MIFNFGAHVFNVKCVVLTSTLLKKLKKNIGLHRKRSFNYYYLLQYSNEILVLFLVSDVLHKNLLSFYDDGLNFISVNLRESPDLNCCHTGPLLSVFLGLYLPFRLE